ncbi:MAG: hypothetical protein K0S56_2772 [Microvirga sp.]|jgi:hypothetical protein|nr:hypothetical protein [Microvirga sp.]
MPEDKLDDRLRAMTRLESVSSSDWQAYTWKNELAEQKRRIG